MRTMAQVIDNLKDGHILEWALGLDNLPPSTGSAQQTEVVRERVLWIDPDFVISIHLSGPKQLQQGDKQPIVRARTIVALALQSKQVRIEAQHDPFEYLATLKQEYKDKWKGSQQIRWDAISEIVETEPSIYFPQERGRLIRKAKELSGLSRPTIYKLILKYWRAGKTPDALFPDYFLSGRIPESRDFKNTKAFSHEEKTAIAESLKKNNTKGRTLADARELIAPEVFPEEVESTGRTVLDTQKHIPLHVLRHTQKRLLRKDVMRTLYRTMGAQVAEANYRPLLSTTRFNIFGTTEIYQLDASTGDIYLVNSIDPDLIIGRPLFYLTIDGFSEMITGLHVTLEGPTWEGGASQALLNSFLPKLPFLNQVGMAEVLLDALGTDVDESIWPVEGLCNQVIGDGELLSQKSKSTCSPLGLIYTKHPARAPYLKGLVEKQIHLIQAKNLKWLPGAVNKWRKEIEHRNYKFDAILTLQDIIQVFLCWIFYWNNMHEIKGFKRDLGMIRDHIPPIPREMHLWGQAHRSGLSRHKTPTMLKLELLPREDGLLTQHGLLFNNMSYIPQMDLANDLFILAAYEGSKEVPVSFDRRHPEEVYLHLPNQQGAVPCLLNNKTDGRYSGFYLEEIQDLQAIEASAYKDGEPADLQARVDNNHVINHITDKARKRSKALGRDKPLTKKERGDVPANREAEISRRRGGRGRTPTQTDPTTAETNNSTRTKRDETPQEKGYLDWLSGEQETGDE